MDGWSIRISGTEEQIMNAEGTAALVPYELNGGMYLPLKEILTAGQLNVISSTSIEKEEFAFAIASSIVSISYTEDQSKQPVNVEAFVNGLPQVLPVRDIRLVDKALYFPVETIEKLTGITCLKDESTKTVSITLPAAE